MEIIKSFITFIKKCAYKVRHMYRNRKKKNIKYVKVVAIFLIASMAFCDWLTMQDLMSTIGVDSSSIINQVFSLSEDGAFYSTSEDDSEFDSEPTLSERAKAITKNIGNTLLSPISIFSLIFVLLLEGIPTFGGWAAYNLTDATIYSRNIKKVSEIVFIMSIITFSVAFILLFTARLFIILESGGIEAFFGGTYNMDFEALDDDLKTELAGYLTNNKVGFKEYEKAAREFLAQKVSQGVLNKNTSNDIFIKDFILILLPLLTSCAASIASFFALGTESAELLEKKVDELHEKYIEAETEFNIVKNRSDCARGCLWSCISDREPMPRSLASFRKRSYEKIKAKLISNSIKTIDSQIKSYNRNMAGVLGEFINEMARNTTNVPNDIFDIDIEDLIKKYDEGIKAKCQEIGVSSSIDAWNYDLAGEAITKKLSEVIDNSVVVAQFKTSINPYYKEGDI